MRLISYDLGERNFACFAIDVAASKVQALRTHAAGVSLATHDAETRVVHWSNTDIGDAAARGKTSIETFVAALAAHIRSHWEGDYATADYVLIEQQLLRNPRMKCASHALQGIFEFNGIPVAMVPPRHKFKGFPVAMTGKEPSRELKKKSVMLAREWAIAFRGHVDPDAVAAMECMRGDGGHTKQDDLADAALQGISGLLMMRRCATFLASSTA